MLDLRFGRSEQHAELCRLRDRQQRLDRGGAAQLARSCRDDTAGLDHDAPFAAPILAEHFHRHDLAAEPKRSDQFGDVELAEGGVEEKPGQRRLARDAGPAVPGHQRVGDRTHADGHGIGRRGPRELALRACRVGGFRRAVQARRGR